MMIELLVIFCITMTIIIFLSNDLIKAAIYLAVLNTGVALIFYFMRAPDLAVTQVSVNAALATIIFIYAIRRCEA